MKFNNTSYQSGRVDWFLSQHLTMLIWHLLGIEEEFGAESNSIYKYNIQFIGTNEAFGSI